MSKIKSGFYWLCHHKGPLVEFVWNEEERRKFIEQYKPDNEQAIRQLCFQPVKGDLPTDICEAERVLSEAWRIENDGWQVVEVKQIHDNMSQALKEAHQALDEARQAYAKVVLAHKAKLETQYAAEYPEAAKHWNGEEIVFGE